MASLSDHLVRPEPPITGLEGVRPDTHPSRNDTHFRRIVAAGEVLARAERELEEAVGVTRAAGDSWTVLASVSAVFEDE